MVFRIVDASNGFRLRLFVVIIAVIRSVGKILILCFYEYMPNLMTMKFIPYPPSDGVVPLLILPWYSPERMVFDGVETFA